jgi:hypothetical protein
VGINGDARDNRRGVIKSVCVISGMYRFFNSYRHYIIYIVKLSISTKEKGVTWGYENEEDYESYPSCIMFGVYWMW